MAEFKFKQFEIHQDRCAMKVGTDGVLLGAWAPGGKRILDIGSGTGLISLMMAQRCQEAQVIGVDLDAEACDEARENVAASPFADRVSIACCRLQDYTLVSVADYVLSKTPGNTVSNLSSTRALRDVTEKHGGSYCASAVGEVNVTTKMKDVHAVIGGEGNGGVIYPESHYGRDALVGIALFLSSLAHKGCKVSELRASFPNYFIAKNRIDLTASTDVDAILVKVKEMFGKEKDVTVTDIDGVKLDFPDKWVHLRKSNTEPIIRVYSEASTMEQADELG